MYVLYTLALPNSFIILEFSSKKESKTVSTKTDRNNAKFII